MTHLFHGSFGVVRRYRGLTLSEVMMALGIFSVILASAISLYSFVQLDRQSVETSVAIKDIIEETRSLYSETYQGIDAVAIGKSALIPQKYINRDTSDFMRIFTFPNGTIGTMVNNGGESFAIYLWQVPSDKCTSLLKNMADVQYFSFIQVAWFQLGYGQPWYTWPNADSIKYSCHSWNKTNMIFIVDRMHA